MSAAADGDDAIEPGPTVRAIGITLAWAGAALVVAVVLTQYSPWLVVIGFAVSLVGMVSAQLHGWQTGVIIVTHAALGGTYLMFDTVRGWL